MKPDINDLSERERQVTELIAQGLKYKEIAVELGLQHETIRTYAARVRKKLGMHSRTEIAIWYVRLQYIEEDVTEEEGGE